jgi:3-methylfumaryl-CoA hydratase
MTEESVDDEVWTRRDLMSPEPMEALDSLIDGGIGSSKTLPPLWHWTFFLDRPAQSDLGPDGHPRIGRPTPPQPGLRRMFAGGRVTTHRLLEMCRPAEMTVRSSAPRHKQGRSGSLWFVTVRYEYSQDGELAVVEERDIVYRPSAKPSPEQPKTGSASTTALTEVPGAGIDLGVSETLLFRFSALTYNAHRIHYDLTWAQHEGYGGLVTHGPLQALLMAEQLRRTGTDLVGQTFSYRLVAPFVGTQRLRVRLGAAVGSEHSCVVLDASGTITAVSTVRDSSFSTATH